MKVTRKDINLEEYQTMTNADRIVLNIVNYCRTMLKMEEGRISRVLYNDLLEMVQNIENLRIEFTSADWSNIFAQREGVYSTGAYQAQELIDAINDVYHELIDIRDGENIF